MNALTFATEAHKGQFRWDGITPYIEHPKAVVKLLKSFKMNNQTTLNAAMLHDVLEDTSVLYSEIRQEFGKECADLVAELTRHKDTDYFEHCRGMSKVASLIKVADILCNITDISSDKSPRFVDKRLQALTILREKTKELV